MGFFLIKNIEFEREFKPMYLKKMLNLLIFSCFVVFRSYTQYLYLTNKIIYFSYIKYRQNGWNGINTFFLS